MASLASGAAQNAAVRDDLLRTGVRIAKFRSDLWLALCIACAAPDLAAAILMKSTRELDRQVLGASPTCRWIGRSSIKAGLPDLLQQQTPIMPCIAALCRPTWRSQQCATGAADSPRRNVSAHSTECAGAAEAGGTSAVCIYQLSVALHGLEIFGEVARGRGAIIADAYLRA